MPHFRTFMKASDSLRAYDLVDKEGNPKDFTLKIARVEQGVMKSVENPKGDKMPMIYFVGATKPLGANVTNCTTIASIAGSKNTDDWPGHTITLYQTQVKGKSGAMTEGIRVRPRKPTTKAEDMPDQPVDQAMIDRQQEAAKDPTDRGDDPDAH